jgi:S-adenosylhomocysteine hydrolase
MSARPNRRFGELPLLDWLASRGSRPHASLGGIILVCVQHLLETTGSLIQTLLSMGLNPKNTYILGKSYSTNPDVEDRLRGLGVHVVPTGRQQHWGEYSTQLKGDVSRLWRCVAEGIEAQGTEALIVLDDGGFCIEGMPPHLLNARPVVGIEQTMSGLALLGVPAPFPVIDVASSAAKQWIEPPMISEAVLARLPTCHLSGWPIGVVGFGNIGKAMTQTLNRIQPPIFVFDEAADQACEPGRAVFCGTLGELYSNAATIFGCTGKDTLAGKDWWPNLVGEKLLISCSSQDLEFRSALTSLNDGQLGSPHSMTSEVTVPLAQGKLRILRGGFPVNFDGSGESVPAADIQMTRGLLLGAILQAVSLIESGSAKPLRTMLLPELQQSVVSHWIEIRESRREWFEPWLLDKFLQDDVEWIADHSGGVQQEAASEHRTVKVP